MNLPDLSGADLIGLDTETCDPDIRELGAGVRRTGYICGISVAVPEGDCWYFPIRHSGPDAELNMDPEQVMRWARDQLTRPNQPKVGANLLYDLDYLAEEGVAVAGPFLDVQIAEPLLDEHRRTYALDSLAQKYLGEGKVEEELYAWCARAYGGAATRRAQAVNIHRAPISLVRPYAEADASLPLRILEAQRRELEREELLGVFDLETRLVPMLLAMKRRGVRVDLPAVAALQEELHDRERRARTLIGAVNTDAPGELAELFRIHGLEPGRTEKGNVSFAEPVLVAIEHEVARAVLEVKKVVKAGQFLTNFTKHEVDGRIHAQFNQLRDDDYGTLSYRFSSSLPNLQNIPARDPELGPRIRGLFVPEDGHQWAKLDFSQIEPRLLLHYPNTAAAEAVRRRYRENPDMDCYEPMVESIGTQPRGRVKGIYLGRMYGMGKSKMAGELGCSAAEAIRYCAEFDAGAPYVAEMFDKAQLRAKNRGWLRTIVGHVCRFPRWESARWGEAREHGTYATQEECMAAHRSAVRAWAFKALNRLIQSGAAGIMKRAMVDTWESGLCDPGVLGAPLLTVHDEQDLDVPPGQEEAVREVARIMERAVELRVPLRVDAEIGPDWGHVKKI